MRRLLVAIGILLAPTQVAGQASERSAEVEGAESAEAPIVLYASDQHLGSQSVVGPVSILANRGFSILYFRGFERRVHRMSWSRGWSNVRGALTDPGRTIRARGGWRAVLADEFYPSNGRVWEWAFAPNYTGHVIAGGLTQRYLQDWFRSRGMPAPVLLAGVFSMGTMVVNEILENQNAAAPSAGTVVDLLFFDPLGILLFQHEGIARFFVETLSARDWSPQASITLPDGQIQNSTQVFAYKVPLPWVDRARLLVLIGQGSQVGASIPVEDGWSLGATLGFAADERFLDPATGRESISAEYAGGLYLDRDHSLVASIVANVRSENRIQANLYPGLLPGPARGLGLWLNVREDRSLTFGIGSRHALGLGFGYAPAVRDEGGP